MPLRVLILFVCFFTFVLAAQSSTVAGNSARVAIDSDAAFNAAVRRAAPNARIILAADARFGVLEIKSRQFKNLLIQSADPARPAHLEGLKIISSSGITLQNLTISGEAVAGERYKLLAFRSAQIRVNNVRFEGNRISYLPAIDSALMFRESKQVEVTNSSFSGFRHGITLLKVEGTRISGNRIMAMQIDGIRGGGVSNASFKNNMIRDFYPANGDHPDGIQLWSRNETAAARNIEISDNLIVQGAGGRIQGIFVHDRIKLPYQNLTISGNLVVGGLHNGITVQGAERFKIVNNSVYPVGREIKSWIRVEDSTSGTVADNLAGAFVIKSPISQSRNRVVGPIGIADGVIAAWVASKGMSTPTEYGKN